MKRSDFYIRLTTAVLFIAVVFYIGIYLYNSALTTYETTSAIRYTVEQTFPARGFIVRTETVLADSGFVVLPIVGEGEKVASGQAIAVEYTTTSALEMASEIRALRLMIAQLEASSSPASAEAARLKTVLDLSKAIQHGDFNKLDELSLTVESTIFSGNSTLVEDLPNMKARLETLEARAAGASTTIHARQSGTFSQVVDGFEYIKPSALEEISPSELMSLFDAPSRITGIGKLVTEFKWYYAAIMDADDAMRLAALRSITVQFSGAYVASLEMQIENVGSRDGDECVVLFSSDRSVHEIAPLRNLNADIVFSIVSGIRVPKEALHLDDDGKTFIYLQTGARAERVDVEILAETGDSYLVRDGAETGTPLRAGSTIIVKANNLFDGKIVG